MQGLNVSNIRPVFKRSKIVSRTNFALFKADSSFMNTFEEGVSIKLTLQLLSKFFIDSDFCHNYLHTLYLLKSL